MPMVYSSTQISTPLERLHAHDPREIVALRAATAYRALLAACPRAADHNVIIELRVETETE